ncbi:MAG: hypothetical protein GXP43_00995 [bacterium]|nr:hypothetical protein [bacterium]
MIDSEWLKDWHKYQELDKKVWLVWGVCLAVIMVLIGGVLAPNIRGYWKLRSKEKILKAQLQKYKKKYNQLTNIKEDKLQEKLNKGLEILPLYHNAPLIIGMLSELGMEKQVRLSSIVFSPGEVASNSVVLKDREKEAKKPAVKTARLPEKLAVGELEIRFRVSGALKNVRSFLVSLGQVKPLVRINKINLTLGSEDNQEMINPVAGGQERVVTADVEIEFFAARLPKKMPGIDDKVYIAPAELEEKYERWLREYRSFSSVGPLDSAAPARSNKRQTPFSYEGE